ncbi:MAG: hypothetical protein R3A10_01225, partial [Caldilineaceae bacterium]
MQFDDDVGCRTNSTGQTRPDQPGQSGGPNHGGKSMSYITEIHGREVLDSRGNPTVEVEVQL